MLSNKEKQRLGGTGADDDDILDDDTANIRVSPDAKQLDQAELQINQKQYSDLQEKVHKFVKQKTLDREAEHM